MARTLSTAEMTLAPGDLKMTTRMAGLPLKRPPVWMFSTASWVSAMSRMRTAPWDGLVLVAATAVGAEPAAEPVGLGVTGEAPLEAVLAVEAPVFEVTAEAELAGRPVDAEMFETGPRSVETMSGA